MNLQEFNFDLPVARIAQRPLPMAHHAKLLNYINQDNILHQTIWDLPQIIPPKSVIIINKTKVIPAFFEATRGQAKIAINLIENLGNDHFECFIKGAKKCRIGDIITINQDCRAVLIAKNPDGICVLNLQLTPHAKFDNILDAVLSFGKMPLPPYIKTRDDEMDKLRYQPIFARQLGSYAAPTASLHFTHELVQELLARECEFVEVLLHVGAGTFKPISVANINDHQMHYEYGEISPQAAQTLNQAKREGRFILTIGTTACRICESATNDAGLIEAYAQKTNIFIKPPYKFKFVENLLTNFHLPQSSLFILVCALIGREAAIDLMALAVKENYRFFSFGDACLLRKQL